MPKIFVIGCNKTATGTLHSLFLRNGLTSLHHPRWNWQKGQFQCYSDGGQLQDLPAIYARYPNAIYILNTRSLEGWLSSRFKMGIAQPAHKWAWPMTREQIVKWITLRRTHHEKVLRFFRTHPGRLIIVNIDRPGWIPYLCGQLNIQAKPIAKVNSVDHMPHVTEFVAARLAELQISGAELLHRNADLKGFTCYL